MLDKCLSNNYDELMMGNRLREVLKREGVTAYRIWKDLGVHQSQLSKFFHGKVNISLEMLERITDYRHVLENYSHPILEFIEWRKTRNNNIEVLNETLDYYRYFDATPQAEFLFDCVDYTINKIIPEEVDYLQKYDALKSWLDDTFQMPDKTVALLIRFLEQNNSSLSKRAREKEFRDLTDDEIREIEKQYQLYFEK